MKKLRLLIPLIGSLLLLASFVVYGVLLSGQNPSQPKSVQFGIFTLLFLPGMIVLAAFMMFGLPRLALQYSWMTRTVMILMLLTNLVLCMRYLLALITVDDQITWWLVLVLAASGFMNYFFILLVWLGRKAGLYGFAVVSLIAFVLNLLVGMPFFPALFLFSAALILFWLVWPLLWQME